MIARSAIVSVLTRGVFCFSLFAGLESRAASLAIAPIALVRGGVEPPGPSSRRTPLAVTEINHTPAPRTDGRDLRFVELYNSSPYSQDIGGYRFSGAFSYTVPSGTVMTARSYLVVAPVPADLAAVYGISNVVGGFDDSDFDGTSSITLNDELGAWLTTIDYADNPPWPVAADGAGHTLVLARPSYGEREADGWAASAKIGGSPGTAEPARPTPYEAVLLNEVLCHAGATPGFVELFNASSSPVSLAGCVLKRGKASSATSYTLPNGTVLPACGFLSFDENTLGFLINGKGDTLWLIAPASAGTNVIDVLRFDNQELGVSYGRYPDGDAAWRRLAAPTPAAANAAALISDVVLNEIMYNPISGEKDDEYVELYNTGTNVVDLTGWKLGGGIDYTFSQSIPAKGYLVVAHDRDALAALYPAQAACIVGDYSGSLGNTRDTVSLSQPLTVMDTDDPYAPVATQKLVVVETVTYRNGGEWGSLADGGGSSLERIDPRADPRLARSWSTSDESQKSDWVTLSYTGTIDNGFPDSNGDPNAVTLGLMDSGECLVDSVSVMASGGANLVNNPSFESGTNSWRFMGSHDQSTVETNAAAPDGTHVLHLRAVDRCHNGMNIVRGLMSATLATSGTGTISVRARWLTGNSELLARTRGSWIETCGNLLTTHALGTPGLPNSRTVSNTPPALFDVIHQPLLPRNGEKITVYARAQDPDGLSAVTLYYHIDGTTATNAVAMVPATGGFYAGEIPAGQPANSLIAFHVEATDNATQPACASYPASAPKRECLVRFNEPLDARSFGVYRFWMTQANLTYWGTREKASNTPVDTTFIYGTNRVFYDAGMMYSGSPFHSFSPPAINNGNIDYEATFPSDNMLLDDASMVLATVGNLGSDATGVSEHFCYSLVQNLGLPHMNRRFVHLYANGTEQSSQRIYEDTEKPNAGMLKHWFPENPDNDFFKVDDWFEYTLDLGSFSYSTARLQKYLTTGSDGSSQVLKLGRYRWNWTKRNAEPFHANDYTHFFGLVETLNTADATAYTQGIQETVNLKRFIGVIAMNQFILNWDSYGFARGKNMFMYRADDGWQLIAWDLDMNFQIGGWSMSQCIDPVSSNFNTEDPTMKTLLTNPIANRIYWRAVQKLLDTSADTTLRTLTRAKYNALVADSCSLYGYDTFLSYVDARRTSVIAQMAAVQAASFSVLSPATTSSTSTNNVVTLAGVAPFAVTSILINGAATPITWTSPSNWTAQVVLNGGTNALKVVALTENGTALTNGTVNLSIAYTGTALDPLNGYLCFSEIMHSPVTNGAAYVELVNRSASTVMNLSGLFLDGNVAFTFPAGTILNPGQYAVVAADADVFASVYGTSVAARVVGVYTGALGTASGRIRLKQSASGFDPDDAVIDDVFYETTSPWPTNAAAGVSLQLINPALDNNRVANWTAETNVQQSTSATVVPWGQTWKYYPTASGYPGDTWYTAAFNDSAWLSGAGALAYETGTTLPVPVGTTLTLSGSRVAYYFRTSFVFDGNPASASLALSYVLDDGAVFYLNGQELQRSSLMPSGTITDTTTTTAYMYPEGVIEGPFTLPATALIKGTNVLAVGVHQCASTSSDLVFGMKLDVLSDLPKTATPGTNNTTSVTLSALPGVWLNELQPINVSGPTDAQGQHEPWVELYNAETTTVSLTGWTLAATEADPGWTFPSGAVLSAHAFLRVWLDGDSAASLTNDLHASFRYDPANGLLLLRAPIGGRTVVLDYLRATPAATDAVYGAYPDGASNPRRWLNPATPGASNRIDKGANRIVINEFMAQNDLYTNPLSGKLDDWFELFNDGTNTVDLLGYVVTDTLTGENPPTPDLRASKALVFTNSLTLVPGQALRIWTGNSKYSTLPYDPANLQAPFGLSKSGDQICLFNASTQLVDRLVYTSEQSGTASMGRWVNGADGELVSFAQPTPGAPNRNPRLTGAVLAQPPAFTVRELTPFCYTNTFVATRPTNFVFRLYPAAGFTLPTNLTFNSTTGVINWTPTEAQGPGFYGFRVCGFITNSLAAAANCDETLLSLSVLETPSAPILGPLTNLITINEGAIAAFTVTVTRAEEIPPYPTSTRLSIAETLPTNAAFNAATGVFRWTTYEIDGPSTNRFTVIAADSADTNVFVSCVVTVKVNEVNSAPVYKSPTSFYLWRNEPFAVNLKIQDDDLPPNHVQCFLNYGPSGLTLNSDTFLLQWQPAESQTGTFTASLYCVDNQGSWFNTTVRLYVDTVHFTAASLSSAASDKLTLKWKSKQNTRYTVQWCADLTAPVWHSLNADSPLAGTGSTTVPLSYTIDPAAFGSPSNAFFRILQSR